MATLTPGILLKLLQSINTNTKPTGEHRSPLLQVTAILPALPSSSSNTTTASTPLELWPNHGFIVQLSDSKNSTYVTLSDRDTDLILSNRLQLGQFVYLDRFIFDPYSDCPLPVVSGLRPVPGRHPFVGSPERLGVRFSDAGSSRDFMIYPVEDDEQGFNFRLGKKNNQVPHGREVLAPMVNDENVIKDEVVVKKKKAATPSVTPQRFRSPSAGRREKERDPSPAIKVKRSASPVPSKCAVPSLVAAKEENPRKTAAREAAIVVPSRYRQPSPTAVGRRAASPSTRRMSLSPARRLSCGGSSGNKKKIAAAIAAGIGVMKVPGTAAELKSGGRKSWEDVGGSVEVKEKTSVGGKNNKPDLQAIIRTQAAMSRRLSDANSLESKDDSSTDGNNKSNSHEECPTPKLPALAAGITIYEKKWTDGSVPFDTVSAALAKLGKEAIQRKAIAATAAAQALQESLATESIVRCLSMFSDLCSTSKAGNPLPTIDRFLSIYDNATKSSSIVDSFSYSHCSETQDGATTFTTEQSKSATAWVEAALSTDLAVVSLLTGQNVDPIPAALPRSSSTKRQSSGNPLRSHSKELSSKGTWSRGFGMKDTAELAAKLKAEMELWFLKFVEESLDAGFRVFNECHNNGKSSKMPFEGGSIAAILSQLKRINDWLDLVVKKRDQMLSEKIERLKRKIYGFVIQHVGTTLDSPSATSS